ADATAFADYLEPLRKAEWVVYAKEPFGGPEAVLAYLSRYTHRVAISNHRLLEANQSGVPFRYKASRIEGPGRYKTMTLPTREFIRRFLMHVLPKGFHRIRHYGLFANGNRAANLARAPAPPPPATPPPVHPRPGWGGRMLFIEPFPRGCEPKHRPRRAPPLGPRNVS